MGWGGVGWGGSGKLTILKHDLSDEKTRENSTCTLKMCAFCPPASHRHANNMVVQGRKNV